MSQGKTAGIRFPDIRRFFGIGRNRRTGEGSPVFGPVIQTMELSPRAAGDPLHRLRRSPPRRGRLSPECRIFMSHICFAVLSTRIQDRLRRPGPSSSEISTLSSELCRAAAWPPPPPSAVPLPDEWPLLEWSRRMRRSRRAWRISVPAQSPKAILCPRRRDGETEARRVTASLP